MLPTFMRERRPLVDPVVTESDLDRFCEHVTSLLGRHVSARVGAPGSVILSVDGPPWYGYAVADLLRGLVHVALSVEVSAPAWTYRTAPRAEGT